MDIGLLILRVAAGGLFVGHGTQKLFGWFGGYGLKGTGQFFESVGYRPGPFMALIAGTTETIGGLLLMTGFLTPLGAAMILGVMLNAILAVLRPKGLFGGYELDFVYAIAAVGLAFAGAGAYSVDGLLDWELRGALWGLGAIALAVVAAGFTLAMRGRVRRPAIPEVEERRAA